MCSTHSVSFSTEDFIVVVSLAWVTGAERWQKGREKGRAFLPYFLLAAATQAVSSISESDQHQFFLTISIHNQEKKP